MTKTDALIRANKDLKKARINLDRAKQKPGSTDVELTNLTSKVDYAAYVVDVIERT